MTRREPVQKRSRERVEAILRAAEELLAEGGVEALSTRSLASYSGIPVATIYRYFQDRDAIIAAYLDHELASIDRAVEEALMAIERGDVQVDDGGGGDGPSPSPPGSPRGDPRVVRHAPERCGPRQRAPARCAHGLLPARGDEGGGLHC